MKSFLFTIILTFSISSYAQSVPTCFKNPDGELKVLFISTYKIKPEYYGFGAKPSFKKAGNVKKLVHVTDKSMTDDNGLLLQEWYKLVKARLEKMEIPVPENFDYLDMQKPAEAIPEMQKKLTGVNQWIMITCNDLDKAQKAYKKGKLTLESFGNVAISIQCSNGSPYSKRGKNLAVIFDKVEKDL